MTQMNIFTRVLNLVNVASYFLTACEIKHDILYIKKRS